MRSEGTSPRVYLAGPDVFLPEPLVRAVRLKEICHRYGLVGVFPLDPVDGPWGGLPEAHRIALGNEAHIRSCDALIANLTPFRGPSADVGTVFEVGFMRALGRPVFGWSNTATLFTDRTVAFVAGNDQRITRDAQGMRDADGMQIEDFALGDNLMIDVAVLQSGGALTRETVPPDRQWSDLGAFDRCVAEAARRLAQMG